MLTRLKASERAKLPWQKDKNSHNTFGNQGNKLQLEREAITSNETLTKGVEQASHYRG